MAVAAATKKAPVPENKPGHVANAVELEDFAAAPRHKPIKPAHSTGSGQEPEEVPESEIDAGTDPDLQAAIEAAEEATAEAAPTEETDDAVEPEGAPADEPEAEAEASATEKKPAKKDDKPAEPEVVEWPEDEAPSTEVAKPKVELPAEAAKELETVKAKLAEVEGHANFGRTIDNLILEFPELELAMLSAFEAKGLLKDEWKPKLETLRKEVAPQMAAPKVPDGSVMMDGYGVVTNDVCKKHYDQLLKTSAFDAQVFFTKWQKAVQDQAERPTREAAKRAEIAKKEIERRNAVATAAVQKVQSGLAALAPKIPQYLKTGADGVTRFTDPVVFQAFQQAAKGVSPDEPVAEVLKYALFKLRRLKVSPGQAPGRKTVKQPVNGARPPHRTTATSKTAPRQAGKGPAGKVGFAAEIEDMSA